MSMNSFHRRNPHPMQQAIMQRPSGARRSGAVRADQLLVQQGLASSRTAARALIESGCVSCDGKPVGKPAQEFASGVQLQVSADARADRFASRGGFKLEAALQATGLQVEGRCFLDVGQSTGGFTDVLLQHGAARVVGVDVGHGQLHPRLAQDARVVCLEGINARYLNAQQLAAHSGVAQFDAVVGDVSFISLTLVLPALVPVLAPEGDLLMLVKPQFELQPAQIGRGGIVRDAALYDVVKQRILDACAALPLQVLRWLDSPIPGGDGNREFFIHAQRKARTE